MSDVRRAIYFVERQPLYFFFGGADSVRERNLMIIFILIHQRQLNIGGERCTIQLSDERGRVGRKRRMVARGEIEGVGDGKVG